MELSRKGEARCVWGWEGANQSQMLIWQQRVFLSYMGVKEDPQVIGKKPWDFVASCFGPHRC